MRNAFINELIRLAEKDSRIYLLCGDLGYHVLEPFEERYPDRFINMGVAEQNMAGVAAGLAMSGKIVFTYSIANFPTLRCLEQIRNDICYHNANVKIVSVGGGLAYGSQGYTHHGVEDIAVMRVLPNMKVLSPGDPVETTLVTRAIARNNGPCYLRLGKAGEPVVHYTKPDFILGKAIYMSSGNDITLISTGSVLQLSMQASAELIKKGIHAQVISMPTLKPFDRKSVCEAAKHTRKIITVEEHGIGGLSSIVAEVIAKITQPIKFSPLHLKAEIIKEVGSQEYLRKKQGISVENIVKTAISLI